MKILSLFDGISCWYVALQRAWIPIDKYYASEIDKYAIQIALKNHPDIIEIWDVCKIKWEDYQDIDLLIWGSPCQGFSVAWKMLNFNDPRSKLFFEYVRLLKEIKPKYFLLENVKMKKEWQDIISQQLWVQPIEINSSLVSAQNRKRLYRTNIPNVSQPKDKGIILKDILQENVDEKYYYSQERWEKLLANKYEILKRLEDVESKCATIVTNWWGNHEKKIAIIQKVWDRDKDNRWIRLDKSYTLPANPMSDRCQMVYIPQTVKVRKYEVDIEKLKSELRNRKFTSHLSCKEIAYKLWVPQTKAEHRFRLDDSFAIPDPEIRFQLKELLEINTSEFDKSITEFEEKPWTYEKAERKILPSWKMTTLTTSQNDDIVDYPRIRKLTPIEYERLQTLPDNYTAGVSDTQRYKMLGNWWTVDVIAHIFSFIK